MVRYLGKLIPVPEALSLLKSRVKQVVEESERPVWESVGLVASRDIVLDHDFPPRPRSAYDGYAVRSDDTPGRLRLVGEATIGKVDVEIRVGPGEAAYVSTGAYLPEGADAVVPEEAVKIEDGYVVVEKHYEKWKNTDPPGSYVRRGEVLVPAGTVLTYPDMVGLLDVAVTKAWFYRPLRVAVIETGTELIQPTTPEETRDRVLKGLVVATTGGLLKWFIDSYMPWVRVDVRLQMPDHLDTLVWYVERLLETHDAVLVTGGTGPSDIDLFYRLPEALGGELVFRGMYVKGGRPTSAVVVDGKPVVGLSGHPLSGLHGLVRLVYPLLAYMGGARRVPAAPFVVARLGAPVKKGRPRPVKVRLEVGEKGLVAVPLRKELQLSSANVGLAIGDGIALVEARDYDEGEEVLVLAYRFPPGYLEPAITF